VKWTLVTEMKKIFAPVNTKGVLWISLLEKIIAPYDLTNNSIVLFGNNGFT